MPRGSTFPSSDSDAGAGPSTVARPHGAEVQRRVGWRFVALYTLAFISTCLLLIAPLLVTLALKIDALIGASAAPGGLALVTSLGALVAMVGNPLFGRMSDRTTWRAGMRRPWMIIGVSGGSMGVLIVAVAPSVPVVLLGWCIAQLFFNALLAVLVAVLPDQVPASQRGLVAGLLGVCVPVASVVGTFVVQLFAPNQLAMFLAPCGIAGVFIVVFAATLHDRRLVAADRPPWSVREFVATFYLNPRRNPDFAWAFASRFLFVLAYAILVTYQAYYLLSRFGSTQGGVVHQVFLGTLVQSAFVVGASLVGGRISDRSGRRKVFVLGAAVIYGLALVLIAVASDFNGFLVGMALGGVGYGVYVAVDLALVADVLPDRRSAGKNLGVFNIAGALPFSIAPALAAAVLALTGGTYAALYGLAAVCAVLAAGAILPVRRVG